MHVSSLIILTLIIWNENLVKFAIFSRFAFVKTASKKHIKNRKYNKARLDGLNLSDYRLQQLELSVENWRKKVRVHWLKSSIQSLKCLVYDKI